jgi:hypothetical protein
MALSTFIRHKTKCVANFPDKAPQIQVFLYLFKTKLCLLFGARIAVISPKAWQSAVFRRQLNLSEGLSGVRSKIGTSESLVVVFVKIIITDLQT